MLAAAALRVTADLDRRVAAEARGARDRAGAAARPGPGLPAVAARDREFWTVFIEFWGEAFHDRRAGHAQRADLRAQPPPHRARTDRGGVAAGAFRRIDPDAAAAAVLGRPRRALAAAHLRPPRPAARRGRPGSPNRRSCAISAGEPSMTDAARAGRMPGLSARQGRRRLPLAQIRARVASAFDTMEALLDGVTEARRGGPRRGEWSIHEVLDHLIVTHPPASKRCARCSPGATAGEPRSRPGSSPPIRRAPLGRPARRAPPPPRRRARRAGEGARSRRPTCGRR